MAFVPVGYANQTTPYFAFAGESGGNQTLSAVINTIYLDPSGGSVNVAELPSVSSSAQKTTAQSYSEGLFATSFEGDLFVKRTEVGTPLEPQSLSVNGTVDMRGSLVDNNTSEGTAGQFLSAGAGGEVVWSTIPGGSGISAVNAGTNISIPDPGIPVVSVAISSDLDMNNNSITSLNSINAYALAQLGINAPGSVSIQTPQLIIPSLASYDANFLTADPFGIITTAPPPASTWVGTATSDLNMNGYNITTPSDLTIASDTGLIKIRSEGVGGANGVVIQTTLAPLVLSTNNEIQMSADGNIGIETSTGLVSISNPTIGVGGAQLNVNGSASIRGDTAQLQVLDGAGVQKGTLSYNSIDGQTHLDGTDLAISGSGIDITAGNDDLILLASAGSVGITAHTDIGISCNNGGTITVGGANTGAINITTTGTTSLTSGEELSLTATNLASLSGLETQISSGLSGLSVSSGATLNLSSADGSDINATSAGNITLTATTVVNVNAPTVSLVGTLDMNGYNIINCANLLSLYADMYANASFSTLMKVGSGLGSWIPINNANVVSGILATGITLVGSLLTIASQSQTVVYRFVATISCAKGESQGTSIQLGVSIDGASPTVGYYTTATTFSTTDRELSVSGLVSLASGSAHTLGLQVLQVSGGATGNNTFVINTLNFNIASV